MTNRYLEQYGHDTRIDHRSHAERGLTEQPTIHEGVVARALEAKGIISDRCELNRQIKADNALLRELKAAMKKLMDAVKNTIPALAEAMESLRSEKKDTSVFNIKKQMELSQCITELTEDLEELRSEKSMLLSNLDCADDKEVNIVRTSVSNMKDTLKNLEASEKKFAAELEEAQKEFAALQKQAANFDPIELYGARQAIRPKKEQQAVRKLQDRYANKYSHMTMVDSKREVSLMLDEYAEGQEIQQMKREQQLRLQREYRQTQPKKKKNRDWER